MTSNTNLPTGFPEEITTRLHEGRYDGRTQLWAPFEFEGQRYKLVLIGNTSLCRKGEERTIYALRSPNGHIVFCRTYPKPKNSREKVWQNYDEHFDYDLFLERFSEEALYGERGVSEF